MMKFNPIICLLFMAWGFASAQSATTQPATEPTTQKTPTTATTQSAKTQPAKTQLADTELADWFPPPGTVSGKVVDNAGKPLAGVTVRVVQEVEVGFNRTMLDTAVAADGSFKFEHLPSGTYLLSAWKFGQEPPLVCKFNFSLKSDKGSDFGYITMRPQKSVREP